MNILPRAGETVRPILAIETSYKGYRLRSRLEARWLCFFDELGIEYWYEPEGFKLPSGYYLPDLYFPVFRVYAEIKPREFTSEERSKIEELSVVTSTQSLLLVGPPDFKTYEVFSGNTGDAYVTAWSCILDVRFRGEKYYEKERRLWSCQSDEFAVESDFSAPYRAAVYASRAARFEERA